MAPTISTNSQQHVTLTHKLRKPLVEKLRRERINSSIEQLKSLLPPEFLTQQQPDSKLEKADILEVTVSFLKRLKSLDGLAVHQGYSSCAREVDDFLSEERARMNFKQLQSSCKEKLREEALSPLSSAVHSSIIKQERSARSAPWRPW
uniref:transcription factor HES-5-like n=1 Tax=Doryrhamphus excisus TaxID=161450 RepID=UPI0025AEC0B6|nr:transcription factor HES-5-like [Doryrhamphus excisus]XP_057910533.1 transcription factor HES-5-like [Doryrhamphus excisus]XP_057910534.1 transcription factor HES-5-like [Doryrhamphus excisus]